MNQVSNIFERIWGKAYATDPKQWKVIAMCILGATTFWFFSALNKQDYSTSINYPIVFQYPGQDSLMVVGELPNSLRINVTSGGWSLFRKSFGIGVEPLQIKLPNPTETRYLLGASLSGTLNEQVKSFRLNRILTDTLHFQIEPRVSKTLAVTIDTNSLNLAPDHILIGEIQLDPDTLQVVGPASFVDKLSDTLHLKIDQQNINENFSDDLSIPTDKEHLTWSVQSIGVQFAVDPLIPVSQLLSIALINFPEGYQIKDRPENLQVTYLAPSSFADSLSQLQFELLVDFNEMNTDSVILPRLKSSHPYLIEPSLEDLPLKVIRDG